MLAARLIKRSNDAREAPLNATPNRRTTARKSHGGTAPLIVLMRRCCVGRWTTVGGGAGVRPG